MTAPLTPGISLSPLGVVMTAPDGARGFDCNSPLSPTRARAFVAKGYRFVCRYVGRRRMAVHDLTAAEVRTILEAGLALVVVQHVEREGWHPDGLLGTEYGTNAAAFTYALGVPVGITLWCDLEGVATGVPAQDVIAYVNAWHDAVTAADYVAGLYVGWAPGLTARQLYRALKVTRYWGAYNVNADQEPVPRGWCLRQHTGRSGTVAGLPESQYDDDTAHADRLGGRVSWLAPTLLGRNADNADNADDTEVR